MPLYRFTVADPMNDWVRAVEVEADNPAQAHARAGSWLFSRRTTGTHETLVHLTLEDTRG